MWRSMVLGLGVAGCAHRLAHGNGVEGSEERSLGRFDSIENEMNVDVRVGNGPRRVLVSCDENLLHLIRTEMHGTTLRIDVPNGTALMPTMPCTVDVTTPDLASVATSGSGWIEIDGDFPELREVTTSGSGGVAVIGSALPIDEIRVSGSGDVEVGSIASDYLHASLSGSGRVTLDGTVDMAELEVSGSGGVFARELTTIDADVSISGSGDIELTATGHVTGHLSGSGKLTLWGDPTVDVDTSGSGDVVLE
jgi:hypothetical protein